MTAIPDYFTSPIDLPFNQAALQEVFSLVTPDQDPGGPGAWVLLQGEDLAVVQDGQEFRLPIGDLPEGLAGKELPLFIGNWQGVPCRMLHLAADAAPGPGLVFASLTRPDPVLPIGLLSLGGLARQIQHWESNSRYCSKCGETMTRLAGEWGKLCPACRIHHFPHIHPCVIVLVRRPGEVLLARKSAWKDGRYSLVAGFLEFGECLEEAVVREVTEETGISISNIHYIGSQSWPFPSQLMAGFIADYAGGEIKVEYAELEDARWFPTDDLPKLPPKRSIARFILDHYLEAGD